MTHEIPMVVPDARRSAVRAEAAAVSIKSRYFIGVVNE